MAHRMRGDSPSGQGRHDAIHRGWCLPRGTMRLLGHIAVEQEAERRDQSTMHFHTSGRLLMVIERSVTQELFVPLTFRGPLDDREERNLTKPSALDPSLT